MKYLNRSAIVVNGKQPFLDWINSVEDGSKSKFTLEQINDESHIYLLGEYNTQDEFVELFLDGYELIFENELNGWYRDESLWPENRTWKMFHQWFDINVASMIFDLCPWKLKKG